MLPTSVRTETTRGLRAYLPLLWLLWIPFLNIFYAMLNQPVPDVSSLVSDLDRLIPFLPVFIIPYVIWYPYIAGTLLLFFFRDRRMYYRTLATLCLGMIGCYIVYAVFQTTVPRPVLEGDGWLIDIVRFVYSNDQPFNCFPSIHVLTCYAMIKGLHRNDALPPAARRLLIAVAWSIIASTVFVKQHVLLDAAGAILLVEVFFAGMKRLLPLRQKKRRPLAVE